MRVLLVNDRPPGTGGGAEVYVGRLAAGLRAAGDDVQVFTADGPRRGVGRLRDVWDPRARRWLRAAAHDFRPDVVHHHNVLRELSVSVLGVPAGVPTVLTVHDFRLLGAPDDAGGSILALAKRAKGFADRAVARRAVDLAVGASPAVADALRGKGFRRVAYVPGFAPVPPPEEEVRPPGESRQVAYAGRLSADKGVVVLASAFEELRRRGVDTTIVFAGEGPERGRLETLAERVGGARVVLAGQLDEQGVRRVMAASRLVVRPSVPALRPEGASLTVVEAALLGRPVVVSDDPANVELVERSGCGLVVPAGSPEALANALERLLSDDGLTVAMGEAGRAAALAQHTVEAGAEHYRALYRRLLDR